MQGHLARDSIAVSSVLRANENARFLIARQRNRSFDADTTGLDRYYYARDGIAHLVETQGSHGAT